MKILSDMKQPRHITIAKQANVAHQQMVNNGSMNIARGGPHARGENNSLPEKSQNELIQINEVNHATLDTGVEKTPLSINAKKIHDWKPWENSTGPTSTEGKGISSGNSLKHG